MKAEFIEGWLTNCFARGERPTYGYPKSALPETVGGDMEMSTGFMASDAPTSATGLMSSDVPTSATQVAEAA